MMQSVSTSAPQILPAHDTCTWHILRTWHSPSARGRQWLHPNWRQRTGGVQVDPIFFKPICPSSIALWTWAFQRLKELNLKPHGPWPWQSLVSGLLRAPTLPCGRHLFCLLHGTKKNKKWKGTPSRWKKSQQQFTIELHFLICPRLKSQVSILFWHPIFSQAPLCRTLGVFQSMGSE